MAGDSAPVRNEFASIEAGFDKLPTVTGNPDKPVFVNAAGTALEPITAASARTKLGVVIGTDVQAYDAELAALAALVSAADRLSYYTGSGTAALATFTAAARTLLAAVSAAAQRTALGSTTVGDAVFIAASAAAARTAMGVIIGTDVQAQDAELAAIAGLVSAADRLPYFTGSGTASLATFTAAARALLDDPNAATMLATLDAAGLSTANVFYADQTISTIDARLILIEADAAADNKRWELIASGEVLSMRAVNDANSVATDAVTVQRTGLTVDSVTLGGTTVAVTNALTVGSTFTSTKAAEAGYSRVSPNMCRKNDITTEISLTRDTLTLITGPTGCTGIILMIVAGAGSANSVAERSTDVIVYSDSGGTIPIAHVTARGTEDAANANVEYTCLTRQEVSVKTNGSYQVWIKFTDDTGNQGAANYIIVGYYD